MGNEISREEIVMKLAELAFSRPDDAVRLAVEPEGGAEGLDLRLVAEVKRQQNGAMEFKFMDREKLLSLLVELVKPAANEGADALYSAIDRAAARLGEAPAGEA